MFVQSKGGEGIIAIKKAIDIGYRSIDTAFLYNNESEVGEAVRDKIAEGVVKREDLFIATKVSFSFHFCVRYFRPISLLFHTFIFFRIA